MTTQEVKGPPQERDVDLVYMLDVLWKWKWLIILGTLVAASMSLMRVMQEPAAFRATATLMFSESRIASPGETARNEKLWRTPQSLQATLFNQSLALETIRQFGLDKGQSGLTPRQFLLDVLSITLPRDTNLITLSVVLPNAQTAADVANYVAQKAVALNRALNESGAAAAQAYIREQEAGAKEEVEHAQTLLVDFKRTAQVENLRARASVLLGQKAFLSQKLSDCSIGMQGLKAELAQLRKALAAQERLLSVNRSIDSDPAVLAAAQEQGARDLRTLSRIQIQSQEINETYQRVQIDLINKEAALGALESQHQDIIQKLKENEVELALLTGRVVDAEARLERLDRDYQLAKEAYQLYARKANDASFLFISRAVELDVVDPAVVPGNAYRRRSFLSVVLASIASAFTLMVLSFVMEYRRQTKPGHARATDRG